MRIKASGGELPNYAAMEWHPTATAPYDCDLELAVVDRTETHTLVCPVSPDSSGLAQLQDRSMGLGASHALAQWKK